MATAAKTKTVTARVESGLSIQEQLKEKIKYANSLAVKRGITTADRPLVSNLSEYSARQGDPIPTGCFQLDFRLGGGIPRGATTLAWGPAGVGKSVLAMSTAAQVIKAGGYVLWILAEEGNPVEAARLMGIDINSPNLIIEKVQGSGEHAFELIMSFLLDGRIPANLLDLVVLDSLGGLEPRSILEKNEKDGAEASANVGNVSLMFTTWTRRLHSTKALGKAAGFFISQARKDIAQYGSPDIMVGGKAVAHAARLELKLTAKNSGKLMLNDEQVGHTIDLEIKKDGYRHRWQGHKEEIRVYYPRAGKTRGGYDNKSPFFQFLQEVGGLTSPSSGRFETHPDILDALPEAKREPLSKFHGAETVKKALVADKEFFLACQAFLLDAMRTQNESDPSDDGDPGGEEAPRETETEADL